MVKQFISVWLNWNRTKPMPSIVNFLVSNPIFRRMALAAHETKQDIKSDADKWLEKELLTKEQYDALYPNKRLNGPGKNSGKWTNK